jgi:predicted cobalt transporter CbtA
MPWEAPRAVALALVLSFAALPLVVPAGAAEAAAPSHAFRLEGAAPAGTVIVHVAEEDWRPDGEGAWAFSVNCRIEGLPTGRLA